MSGFCVPAGPAVNEAALERILAIIEQAKRDCGRDGPSPFESNQAIVMSSDVQTDVVRSR